MVVDLNSEDCRLNIAAKKHLIYRVPIGLNNLMKLMFVFKIVLRGNSFTLVNLNEGILIGTLILV